MEQNNLGRKVFFLYPHSVIQDDLVDVLLSQEYEIYLLKDHRRAKSILTKYKGSIFFINIDKELKESEWEDYIKDIMSSPETSSTLIGVLSYSKDQELAKKYLMELSVPCGFVHLKQGLKDSTEILLKMLEANEAKGRRKFVRANCAKDTLSVASITKNDSNIKGNIIDISSVGMACAFERDPALTKNSVIPNMSLRLRGPVISVTGIVYGTRQEDEETIHVILFHPNMEKSVKAKIRRYINEALQTSI